MHLSQNVLLLHNNLFNLFPMRITHHLRLLFLLAIAFACSKSESLQNQPEKPEEAAERIMLRAIQKFAEKDKSEISSTMRVTKSKLDMILSGRAKNSSMNDVPLEDVFYIYEGLINADNANFEDNADELPSVTANFTTNIFKDEQNNYFIEANDFITLYSDLQNEIVQQIDTINDETLLIADLQLLTVSNDEATLSLTLYPGLVGPSWMTPSGSVHAAMRAGWCSSGQGNVDAADFLDSYINNTKAFAYNNNCPSGTQPFGLFVHTYNTYFPAGGMSNPSQWTTHLKPFYWKSNSNDCIGDNGNQAVNNDIWYSWYSKMDYLADYELPYAQSINPDAELFRVDWHSHGPVFTGPFAGGHNSNEDYFHGGRFFYADCGCF